MTKLDINTYINAKLHGAECAAEADRWMLRAIGKPEGDHPIANVDTNAIISLAMHYEGDNKALSALRMDMRRACQKQERDLLTVKPVVTQSTPFTPSETVWQVLRPTPQKQSAAKIATSLNKRINDLLKFLDGIEDETLRTQAQDHTINSLMAALVPESAKAA